ncbi:MAG: ABC transporter ATP-binding protein [Candidatus Moranbacteria bacterium]|jgi:subfamily B ATP-binding cassette protein MsbA|nr:ABC transporter ATP-binding protein [Candidatus Moranbacteria bacterium]
MFKKSDFQPLVKYLKPYKKDVWKASVFVILENLTYLVLPIIYSQIVDIVVKGSFFEKSVYFLLALWATVQVLGSIFAMVRISLSNALGYQASSDLINNSVDYLVRLPIAFHKQNKIGEVVQRFSRADGYLYTIIDRTLFSLLPHLITSFLSFAVILWINWVLALVYFLFITIYIILTVRKTEPIIVYQKKLNKFFEKYYGNIFDRTPNIINIKSNTREDYERDRNKQALTEGFGLNKKQVKLWVKMMFWQELTQTVSFVILFSVGIYLVSRGISSIGQFVMLLAYINFLSNSINMLGGSYKQLQEGLTTIKRADKIFGETQEAYEVPGAVKIKNPEGNIEFKEVGFSYEDEKVLDNISFKVRAGEMVAIVGKSGEGKSTLVDLISRYNTPQKGKILFDGVDIGKMNLADLRNNIAIVPQEVALFNDTIKNNIAYANLEAGEEDVIRSAKLANCHQFIQKFPKKYEQVVGEKGVKLSIGQKQRVAIARAILRNPRILILDEATSALDSESEKYVQEALEEVMKNRTTFVIAHRLSTIRKADLILVIEKGKIVESGDHKELMNHGGVYKKLSELQNIQV